MTESQPKGTVRKVPEDLLATKEASALLGMSRQAFTKLVERYLDFPSPRADLSVGRIWARNDVVAWALRHGRTVHE